MSIHKQDSLAVPNAATVMCKKASENGVFSSSQVTISLGVLNKSIGLKFPILYLLKCKSYYLLE